MHGPTCIFWANLTTFSLQINQSYAAFWASVLGEASFPRVTDYSQNISFRPCGNRSSPVCRTNSPTPPSL